MKVTISQRRTDDSGWGFAARIQVTAPGVTRAEREELTAAHALCPCSRAVGDNILVEVVVV